MQTLNEISVQFLKGVGPARKKLLLNLGVDTIEDLLYLFPRRYEDRRNVTSLAKVKVGEWQTVSGKIISQSGHRAWYTKKHLTEVWLDDGTGRIACVWFNQPYIGNYLQDGKRVVCYGKVDIYKSNLQMVSPEYEIIDDDEEGSLSIKRIVPIYPLTRGVTQRYLRKIIYAALDKYSSQLRDELNVNVRNKYRLYNIKRTLLNLHFPKEFKDQEEALRRVSFEEFYFFQISALLRRLSITQKEGFSHKINDSDVMRFISSFPFDLTKAQKKVIREIREDMQKDSPMLRLLQGDVGSGKTVTALFGCYNAFLNKKQSAIMAPTEILARQHYENALKLSENGPLKGLRIGLWLGAMKKKEKEEALGDISQGKVDLIIGTHALISEDIKFKDLSFAVIDEQHKFGVRQRAILSVKGNNPDVLIMTATPIPRSLCLTLYGDLDVSVLDEMPPGRGKTITSIFDENSIEEVYESARKYVKMGKQVYFIYPIIDESSNLDLKAAEESYKNFKGKVFKEFRIGLVHGGMNRDLTEKVMESFKEGNIDILVSTSILEVGIDIPNATVMVIEHAERFGLAQLHQLRGRIGRGRDDSLCLLVSDATNEDAQLRLKAILSTNNGFEIAQKDLEIRGPGQFFGRHQHGLNELKVVNPATQLELLEIARNEAILLIQGDPNLEIEENKNIKKIVKRRYPSYLKMVSAG
ncbi:MAG: ATP-dependent DNA helicase RecG [Candidatus Omnitrophica bacterium]|nr:ATP-dependent DNA helicase RecG [Candidatus Omnitrophota bacterium]